jgi:SAM-dependent methyltransferase
MHEPIGTGPIVDIDTYGQLLRALYEGHEAHEIMERSDGLIYAGHPSDYFDGPADWPAAEQSALALARGRVLDIGCGAGRIALALQDRGLEVAAIDEAPSAVWVAQARGVRFAQPLRWEQVTDDLDAFDTIVLARNNFAMPHALLISDTVSPSRGGDTTDDYFYRVRYENRATPWFKYLMFEPDDLASLVAGTGWKVHSIHDTGEPRWNFVLEFSG